VSTESHDLESLQGCPFSPAFAKSAAMRANRAPCRRPTTCPRALRGGSQPSQRSRGGSPSCRASVKSRTVSAERPSPHASSHLLLSKDLPSPNGSRRTRRPNTKRSCAATHHLVGGNPVPQCKSLETQKVLPRRTRVLPELDLETVRCSVDAHVRLDEPGDEHGWRGEVSGKWVELPWPASGVDESAAWIQLRRRGSEGTDERLTIQPSRRSRPWSKERLGRDGWTRSVMIGPALRGSARPAGGSSTLGRARSSKCRIALLAAGAADWPVPRLAVPQERCVRPTCLGWHCGKRNLSIRVK
jgi:hypothetical protein